RGHVAARRLVDVPADRVLAVDGVRDLLQLPDLPFEVELLVLVPGGLRVARVPALQESVATARREVEDTEHADRLRRLDEARVEFGEFGERGVVVRRHLPSL